MGRVTFVPCQPGLPWGASIGSAIGQAPLELHPYSLLSDSSSAEFVGLPTSTEPESILSAFAIGLVSDEVLLVTGGEIERVPRASGGEPLSGRLASAASYARRVRARALRRQEGRDALLLLGERLIRARSVDEVSDALLELTARVVGGAAALLALRVGIGTAAGPLAWRSSPIGPRSTLPTLPPLSAEAASRLSISGVVSEESLQPGDPLAGLGPVFEATRASRLAFVALGRHGTLFVAERRPEREFDPEDWHLFGVLARQAEAAFDRVSET